MNAVKPSNHPNPPLDPSRRALVRVRRRQRRNPYRTLAAEATVKLAVNFLLGTIAVAALVKLLPHNLSQQTKLKELNAEVAEVEARVGQLQADFDRHFDPQQAMSVMQEESVRVDPMQRQVVWTHPTQSSARSSEDKDRNGQQVSSGQYEE